MVFSIKFSDVRGENVSLTREKNSASWKHLYSGGMVFSQLPLETGNRVKLTVRGTSIVHVGFYTGDPSDVTNIKDLHRNKKVDLIAQLDVYKNKCSAHLEKTVSSFTYIHEDIPYTKNISPETDIWVAVYIQFGDACVRLYSETELMKPIPFHTTHGKNIQFLDTTRTTAKLQIHNPAATSCIELNPTEEKGVSVTLRLKPCMTGIKKYGLSLLASHSNSKLLRTLNEYMFMTDSKIQQQQKCTSIQSFERKSGKFNTCDGELTVKVEHGGKVKYHHDLASPGSAQVTEQLSQSGGITLVLDMLRVTVDIIDACEYDARCGSDDEECSSMSSVNSTSVVSTCLHGSVNSPTGTTPQFRKQLAEGILYDSSFIENTESPTAGPSDASFKQPQKDSKNNLPTAKERLDAWVQETTRFNTPASLVRFIIGEDQSEKTEMKVPVEDAPTRKRKVVSPLAEECSSMSSVNSTSVVSKCLHGSVNSPTGTTPQFRKQLAEGILNDSSFIENTESPTAGPSDASFKQPQKDSKNNLPTAKERLDACVQETTRFNTPASRVRFIIGEGQSEKTERKVPVEDAPTRKRKVVSPLAESEVQPKRIRLHKKHITYNESKTEQETSFSSIPSIGHTSIWGNDVKSAPGETQLDTYFGPRSKHTEIENWKNTNESYFSSVQNNLQNTHPHSTGGSSTEKNEEYKRTSPTNARLESKRSKIGIRVLPPTRTANDEMKSGALVSRRHGSTRTLQHNMTYPDISMAMDHSEIFYDDYRVALQHKATKQYYLKEKIKQNYTSLVEQLTVVPLVDYLYEADILEEDEQDRFSSLPQSSSTNRELLKMLRRKPVDKDKFVEALRNAKLDHLIQMFM